MRKAGKLVVGVRQCSKWQDMCAGKESAALKYQEHKKPAMSNCTCTASRTKRRSACEGRNATERTKTRPLQRAQHMMLSNLAGLSLRIL